MTRKRGNNEGSISRRKDDGGWMGRYTLHTTKGSKRRTVYGKTRAEAAERLTKAMADRDGGLFFDAGSLTVAEYLDGWLRDSVRDTVRASTYERNEQIMRLHIKPALGKLKLKSLTPAHVQGLYRDRLDSGLAPATVHKVHVILHKALAQAVRWSLVPRNVSESVRPPRPTPEEMCPLSPEEARRLLEAARGNKLEVLYVLAIHTGMRQGELLALKWQDVNLENATIGIRRTLTKSGGRLLLGETKTKKSCRTVRLTETVVRSLREHLARQMEDIGRLGDLYKDDGLVFTSGVGTVINPTNLRKRSFATLLERANLPRIRFHDLRHTCATLLLGRNVHPKYVQELLGHANIAITLDTYSHVIPGMGDQTARAMEDVLS
jgi:integrase